LTRSLGKSDRLLEDKERRAGKMFDFEAQAYGPIAGQKAINIFFKSLNERGLIYHRILLTGDSTGYKVSGIFIAEQSYPQEYFRWEFKAKRN
jgi:hypothetical protein